MFHQSFNPFVRLDIPLRMPKEISPRQKRKSLARRLEEQERELQQLSFEELPMEMQLSKSNAVKEESSDRHGDDSSCHPHLLDEEDANNSLGSCPITQSASGPLDDGDLLDDAPDSPMTYPPRTVMVRTFDPHATPKTKNGVHRKRIFSLDFSTICTERGETSDGDKSLDEEDDISRGEDPSATSFDHEDDGDDEWDDTLTYGTAATYPPRSIVLVPNNHLDVIATPRRSRTYRSYSSDLSSSSSHGQNSSPSHHPLPFPTLPKLEESQLWAHDDEYFEPLYKFDLTTDETDEDEDQIPHVMSCPEIFGDTDDDISEVPYDDTEGHEIGLIVHFIESASCPGRVSTPGRLSTEGSIASLEI